MDDNKFSIAPLPAGFMLTSLVGLLLSVMWIYPQSASWGLGIGIIFAIMLVSSLISMTYGPTDVELEYYRRVVERAEKKRDIAKKK
jgi:hypothetical protein